MNVILIVISIVIITLLAISTILLLYLKNKKIEKKKTIIPKEEIEILIYQDENQENNERIKELPSVSDDTLNLDDLFKTMSIHVIKDNPDFDFGLKPNQKSIKK